MRNHTQIVREFGATRLHQIIVSKVAEEISLATVQRWADRGSIPSQYWRLVADNGIATLAELADAAAQKLIPANDNPSVEKAA